MLSFNTMQEQMTLEIRDERDETLLEISASSLMTVFELKKVIENEINDLQFDNMILIFDGGILCDFLTLTYQRIHDGSIIYAISKQNQIQNELEESNQISENSNSPFFLNIIRIKNNRFIKMHARVKSDSLIGKLDSLFTNDAIYIFNGMVLDKNKSFCDYDLVHDSNLIVFQAEKQNNSQKYVEKWLELTKENGKFQSYLNLKTRALQSSRLADIKYNNMELKRRCFRSVFKEKHPENDFPQLDSDKTQLITDYDPIESPSVNPLPILTDLI